MPSVWHWHRSGKGTSERASRIWEFWGGRCQAPQPSTVGATPVVRLSLGTLAQGWLEWLLASVDISHAFTPPAADIAAPDKLALASLHVPDHVSVVAPAAAEEVAAVCALWRAVALSALGPWDPEFLILYTVIRRLINVEQIILVDWYFPLIFLSPVHFPLYFVWDLDTVFIFILQQTANLFERRHGFPACFHSTGAGNSVTPAL